MVLNKLSATYGPNSFVGVEELGIILSSPDGIFLFTVSLPLKTTVAVV